MKLKQKVLDYFRTCWSGQIFMKSVSLLVAVCFIINLANLPAYSERHRRTQEDREQIEQVKDEGASQAYYNNAAAGSAVNQNVTGSPTDLSVTSNLSPEIQMMLNQVDLMVNDLNNVIAKTRDGEEFIVGTWDEDQERVITANFGEGSTKDKDGKKRTEDEYTYRVREYFEKGGVKGKKASFISTYGPRAGKGEGGRGKDEDKDASGEDSKSKDGEESTSASQPGNNTETRHGDGVKIPASDGKGREGTRSTEDGSFVRISNVRVTYNIPTKGIKWVSRVFVRAAVYNPYVFTKYSGYDPEVNGYTFQYMRYGLDSGSYPSARSYIISIGANF